MADPNEPLCCTVCDAVVPQTDRPLAADAVVCAACTRELVERSAAVRDNGGECDIGHWPTEREWEAAYQRESAYLHRNEP